MVCQSLISSRKRGRNRYLREQSDYHIVCAKSIRVAAWSKELHTDNPGYASNRRIENKFSETMSQDIAAL